jgi:hypothetical protein
VIPFSIPNASIFAAYQVAGRIAEAIPLHERSLADDERVLGPDHSDTAITRSNLASAYESAKQASSSGDRGRANG